MSHTQTNQDAELDVEFPTGCSMVHPFTLRPDVDWCHESDTFDTKKWKYTESTAKNDEFERFQYNSFLGIIIPISLWFADLFYPVAFYPPELLARWWMILFITIGVLFMPLIPMHIYSYVRKSGDNFWRKAPMANEVLGLLNFIVLSGLTPFRESYTLCGEADDFFLGTLGRDNATYGFNEEREEIYCRQSIHGFRMFTLLCAPVATNLAPRSMIIFYSIHLVWEILSRPLLYAEGTYDPIESWQHILAYLMVHIFGIFSGFIVYYFRTKATQRQFVQTVVLATEIQQAKATEENVDMLLCATVPASALLRLASNQPVSDYTPNATVLFSDMVHFTAWSSSRSPDEVVRMLNVVTEALDMEAVLLKVEKVKTIGDAYWAVTGLPEPTDTHALAMCHFGLAMLRVVKKKAGEHPEWGAIQIRIGIHSGPLNGGILGNKMISYEVFGETSDIANLLEQKGVPSQVLISEATVDNAEMPKDAMAVHSEIEGATADGATIKTYLLTHEFLERADGNYLFVTEAAAFAADVGSIARSTVSKRQVSAEGTGSLMDTKSMQSAMRYEVDDGKERRKAFLKQKAAAQAKRNEQQQEQLMAAETTTSSEASSRHQDSAEVIEIRYSKLKWRYLIGTYADTDCEERFRLFALEKHRPIRFWTRVSLVVLPIMMLISSGIEQSDPTALPMTGGSVICLVLALLTALADVGLLYATAYRQMGPEWPVLQCVLNHSVSVLLQLACLFATPRASVMTNDSAWLSTACLTLNHFANSGGVIGTLWLALGNIFLVWPVSWVASWRSFSFGVNRATDGQALVIIIFICAVFERQTRQQFLEVHLQEFFHREQLKRVAEQDALLKSIVPEHISSALLTWMSGDMKTPLVRNYNNCAVAFMHLVAPQAQKSDRLAGCQAETLIDTLRAALPTIAAPAPMSQNGVQKIVAEDATHGTETDFDAAVKDDAVLMNEDVLASSTVIFENWLAKAITQVDEVLAASKAISKIKTIGDTVMLAGPFNNNQKQKHQTIKGKVEIDPFTGMPIASLLCDQQGTEIGFPVEVSTGVAAVSLPFNSVEDVFASPEQVQVSLEELVQVAHTLMTLLGKRNSEISVETGIHCGPLVGAIQGTSRLCFDVFGDTVNVASRCMSGGAKLKSQSGGIRRSFTSISAEAKAVLCGGGGVEDLEGEFSCRSGDEEESMGGRVFVPVKIVAKGKGELAAFFIEEQ